MSDGKIHLPLRNAEYLRPGQQAVIRITPMAYNALINICNKTTLPLKSVASEIILQSIERIVFDEEKTI